MSHNTSYPGQELELFAEANHWKSYIQYLIQPYLCETVLEVGAGIGGMTKYLNQGTAQKWLCLEPDEELLAQLQNAIQQRQLPDNVKTLRGTVETLEQDQLFNSLLYMDVLEHIETDQTEANLASQHVCPGGHLIVLSPAHQFLYTPFDKSIGHFRRYSKSMIRSLQPTGMELIQLRYLDSVGFFASLANRLLLKQQMPTKRQIRTWDSCMVPLSRWADVLTRYTMGKSVLAIWRKT